MQLDFLGTEPGEWSILDWTDRTGQPYPIFKIMACTVRKKNNICYIHLYLYDACDLIFLRIVIEFSLDL